LTNEKKKDKIMIKKLQARVLVLTYISYCVLHFNRESWSLLKTKVAGTIPGMNSSALGAMDTIFLSMYSIGLFISGSMGDHYNPKSLIIYSYLGVSIVITLFTLGREMGIHQHSYYYFLFGLNGLL
jgi:sugar phosphate permease